MPRCEICRNVISEQELVTHLKTCVKGNDDSFLIHAFAHPYYIYFSVSANSSLNDVDRFIRKLWVECCNHPSKFTINKTTYFSLGQEIDECDKTTDVKISEIFQPGMEFYYEYDFASPTNIDFKVIDRVKGNGIKLLARNEKQEYKCKCGKSADHLSIALMFGGNAFLCSECSKKYPNALPVVNSPRMGMCKYKG